MHCALVSSEAPALTTKNGVFFSSATFAIASAAAEFAPAISMFTPFWSSHSRAREEAMSARFWWSATRTSTFLPATTPPRSATAILIASAPPGPSASADSPDMSVMKPMRVTPSSACAGPAMPNRAANAAAQSVFFMFGLPTG
ncbi:hypothetical protein D9M69_613470 [compost metagenome]